MSYTAEEVIQFCEEEDVSFIRLAFCDIFGKQKNIAIMPFELRRAFSCGIAIDASAVSGFGGLVRSDFYLHPNPDTLMRLPWRPEAGSVVRMFCDVTDPSGNPLDADCRQILQRTIAKAAKKGISFNFGAEMEFYLFKTDENGNPTSIPYDQAGYMDIAPEDKGENVRREICLTLLKMGILPESSHHEEGPGQNEIDFRYSDPLSAADNAVTFRSVVRSIAMRNGLAASFMPKPLKDAAGSGMHINLSVRNASGEDLLPYAVAGIMEHIREITLFLNPTENSYERLGKNKAPGYVSWSHENRSQLIRIPAADSEERRRVELRSADPTANPYLAYMLLMEAVMDGIDRKLCPLPAADQNFFAVSDAILADYKKLPASLSEAVGFARESAFLKELLPESLLLSYCDLSN